MQTKVKIKQRDSSGYKVRQVSLTEQMQVDELVSLFIAADLKIKEELLTKLRK